MVITTDSKSNNIEVSNLISLVMTQPSTVNIFTITSTITTVNSPTTFNVLFRTQQFIPKNAILELIFPDELPISQIKLNSIQGVTKITPVVNYTINGQKILMTNAISIYYLATEFHSLKISTIENPNSTKPTGNFQFNVYTAENYKMYTLSTPVTYTATAGKFSNINITQGTNEINLTTNYIFTFYNNDAIETNSTVVVRFPVEISIKNQARSKCLGIFSGLSTGSDCEVINSVLTIYNGFPSIFKENNQLSFSVNNITNYFCVKPSSSFSIESYTSSSYLIDIANTGVTVNFTEGQLVNPSIIRQSQRNYDMTAYTISFRIKNILPVNSKIMITFPSGNDVIVTNIDSIQNKCSVTVGTASVNATNICSVDGIYVIVQNINTNNIPADTQINILLPEIRNPRSLKPSSSFLIRTQTADNCFIDKSYTDLLVTNTLTSSINNVVISPSSMIAGDTSNYLFSITISTYILTGDILEITFPNQIKGFTTNNLTITGKINLATNLTGTVTKNINGLIVISISLVFTTGCNCIQSSEKMALEISNLINPNSLEPSDSFYITIKTSAGSEIEKYLDILNITLNTPNNLHDANIKVTNVYKNATSEYSFQFTPFNVIPKYGKILIFYPTQISVIDKTCTEITGLSNTITCTNDAVNRIITVNQGFDVGDFTPSPIQFNIKALKNTLADNQTMTDTFKIFTVTQDGYKIDQKINGLIIIFNCQLPCGTCASDQKTCVSCTTTSTFNILHQGQCLSQCPDGYISEKNTCTPCNPTCATCQTGNKDKCIKCKDSKYIYNPILSTCTMNCDQGYYPDSDKQICQPCMAPCYTCLDSQRCLSCQYQSPSNSFYLYYPEANKCLAFCPTEITVKSAVSNTCLTCDSNCLKCSNDVKSCTACQINKVLFENKCIDPGQCPKGYYADMIKQICSKCDENCLECGNSFSSCKECKNGYILNSSSTCVTPATTCPDGFFIKNNIPVCETCNFPCLTCNVNANFCTACLQGLYLQNNQCVEKCDKGSFIRVSNSNSISECIACDPSCKTCSGPENICTSCNENSYLYDAKCLSRCPNGYYSDLNSDLCTQCLNSNCDICNSQTCLRCSNNFYLYEGHCYSSCPQGFKGDNISKTCKNLKKVYSFYPYRREFIYLKTKFIFIILSVLLLLGIYIYKYNNQEIYFCGSVIGFISVLYTLHIYFYFYYSFVLGIEIYFIIIAYCVVLNVLFNTLFILFYEFYTNSDNEFTYWKSSRRTISCFLFMMAYLIDFKCIRLFYSRLCLLMDAKFENYNRIHLPYKKLLIAQIFLTTLPITTISIFILICEKTMTDLWYTSMENLIMNFLIFLIELIDLNINSNPNTDFFNEKKNYPDVIPFNTLSYRIDKKFNFEEANDYIKNGNNKTNHISFTSILNSPDKVKKSDRRVKFNRSTVNLSTINKIEVPWRRCQSHKAKVFNVTDNKLNIKKFIDDTDTITLSKMKHYYSKNDLITNLKGNKVLKIIRSEKDDNKSQKNIINKLSSGFKSFVKRISLGSSSYKEFENENFHNQQIKAFGNDITTPTFNTNNDLENDKSNRSNIPLKIR